MKSLKITPPAGYEIDTENSTLEEIVFKPINITYTKICKELFKDKLYHSTGNGEVVNTEFTNGYEHLPNNAGSSRQVKKVLALNMLINIAAYFNSKRTLVLNQYYTIIYEKSYNSYNVYHADVNYTHGVDIIFKDKKDALAVINNPDFRNILDTVYK